MSISLKIRSEHIDHLSAKKIPPSHLDREVLLKGLGILSTTKTELYYKVLLLHDYRLPLTH